jgi:hypothetical protein
MSSEVEISLTVWLFSIFQQPEREVDRAVVAAATAMLIMAAKPHLFSIARGVADPPRST